MRCFVPLLLVVGCAAAVGCLTENPRRTTSWFERAGASPGPTGSQVVQMDVAILEQPAGNPYVNDRLWTLADEQFLPLDRKTFLIDNGLHVGLISGGAPPGLQELLTSERSCPNPRHRVMQADTVTRIEIGGELEAYTARMAGDVRAVDLRQAQCVLDIEPGLTREGSVRLKFTPRVLHGGLTKTQAEAAEALPWLRRLEKPVASFESLSWEVILVPNEYVVVGGCYERPRSLGNLFFVRPGETPPVQRLLVIRASRYLPDEVEPLEDNPTSSAVPPLAVQATCTSGR